MKKYECEMKAKKETWSLSEVVIPEGAREMPDTNILKGYWDKVKGAADELQKHGGVDVVYKHTDQGVELLPVTDLSKEEFEKRLQKSLDAEMQEKMKAFDKKMQEELSEFKGAYNEGG